MYNSRYDDDCLSIARSIYEAYLRMKLLRLIPECSERFEAMLAHETGAFPTKIKKNGQPQYDTCVDPSTGKEFKITISNREIIEASDFPLDAPIYYDLYPLLSGFVHPELAKDAFKSIVANRADDTHDADPIFAIILIHTICVLLLLEVAESRFLKRRTIRDVRHIIKQVSVELLNLLTSDTILRRANIPKSVYNLFGLKIEIKQSDAVNSDQM